jgi:hypothetical protein
VLLLKYIEVLYMLVLMYDCVMCHCVTFCKQTAPNLGSKVMQGLLQSMRVQALKTMTKA